MRLKDKIVVITASTRGIGKACVEACVKEHARVYMAVRNEERANKVREELLAKYSYAQIEVVYNDAMQLHTYGSMIDEVYNKEGRIDVLINNFGTSDPQRDLDIENTDYEVFRETIDINLASVFLPTQRCIEYMKKQNSGSIINISSVGGVKPDLSQIAYGTSKAAINYLTLLIATQVAKYNIRCNAVLPGMTATDAVNDKLDARFKEIFTSNTPLSRMATPEEIASAVVYFASDESSFTTGQILEVSGGFGMPTPIYSALVNNNKR